MTDSGHETGPDEFPHPDIIDAEVIDEGPEGPDDHDELDDDHEPIEPIESEGDDEADAESWRERATARVRKIAEKAGKKLKGLRDSDTYKKTKESAKRGAKKKRNAVSDAVIIGTGKALVGIMKANQKREEFYGHEEKGRRRVLGTVLGAVLVVGAGYVVYKVGFSGGGGGGTVREAATNNRGGGSGGTTATTMPGSRSTTTTMPGSRSTATTMPGSRSTTTTAVPGGSGGEVAPPPATEQGVTGSNGHHYTRGQVRQLREALNTQERRDAFDQYLSHPHRGSNMVEHGFRTQVHTEAQQDAFDYMSQHPHKTEALIRAGQLQSPEFAQLADHTHKMNHVLEVRQQNVLDIRADHPFWSSVRVQQAADWVTHLQLQHAAEELADKAA